MNDIMTTLKSKAGPLPVWAWTLLGSIALALVLIRKKNKSGDTSKAAADQTNSDLGSAAELANMFEVAGLMPYQGGDVYINTTTTQNPPPSPGTPTTLPGHIPGKPPVHQPHNGGGGTPPIHGAPKPRATYTVKHGDTLTSIAKKYGTTADAIFKFNTTPGVRPADTEAVLKKRGKNLIYANEKILIPPKGYK